MATVFTREFDALLTTAFWRLLLEEPAAFCTYLTGVRLVSAAETLLLLSAVRETDLLLAALAELTFEAADLATVLEVRALAAPLDFTFV